MSSLISILSSLNISLLLVLLLWYQVFPTWVPIVFYEVSSTSTILTSVYSLPSSLSHLVFPLCHLVFPLWYPRFSLCNLDIFLWCLVFCDVPLRCSGWTVDSFTDLLWHWCVRPEGVTRSCRRSGCVLESSSKRRFKQDLTSTLSSIQSKPSLYQLPDGANVHDFPQLSVPGVLHQLCGCYFFLSILF